MTSKSTYKKDKKFEPFFCKDCGLNILSDPAQYEYVESILSPSEHVSAVFSDSQAGTGKTTLALVSGIYGLNSERFDRIIYIRNSELVESIGFLPGDLEGKMGETLRVCVEALDHVQPGMAKRLLGAPSTYGGSNQLELKPLATLRGRDFGGSPLIIIDEAQNLTVHQLQTVLTRPHDTAKIVIIGSSKQVDPGNAERIGLERLLAFQAYALHFKWNPSIHTVSVNLTKNYRGKFSQYADKIGETISWLHKNKVFNEKGEEINARRVTSDGVGLPTRRPTNSVELIETEE